MNDLKQRIEAYFREGQSLECNKDIVLENLLKEALEEIEDLEGELDYAYKQ